MFETFHLVNRSINVINYYYYKTLFCIVLSCREHKINFYTQYSKSKICIYNIIFFKKILRLHGRILIAIYYIFFKVKLHSVVAVYTQLEPQTWIKKQSILLRMFQRKIQGSHVHRKSFPLVAHYHIDKTYIVLSLSLPLWFTARFLHEICIQKITKRKISCLTSIV